jgi:hypothetical protein
VFTEEHKTRISAAKMGKKRKPATAAARKNMGNARKKLYRMTKMDGTVLVGRGMNDPVFGGISDGILGYIHRTGGSNKRLGILKFEQLDKEGI